MHFLYSVFTDEQNNSKEMREGDKVSRLRYEKTQFKELLSMEKLSKPC